jgi:hypothetical protein
MVDPQPPVPPGSAPSPSTPLSPVFVRETPPSFAEQVRGLVRFIYTNNPFYVLSAWLVFWGLRSSFDTTGETFETGALMLGLAGYTVLLAVSACFLIRVGRVWDDVRSMLVLVVLMFLAISVSFDDALASNSRVGIPYYLAGLAFAVAVSEGVLWGIRLSLPAMLRVPYYLILALFFLYPVAISRLIRFPSSPALHWALFGFSSVAGLVFLTLLPAVRRGAEYVRENGSPWPWPWYPWVLFGVLGLGVCGRAYYLCVSLHFVGGTASIFGFYFWVPFLLAANVLLLEMGLTSHSAPTTRWALVAPLGLAALAITGPPSQAADHGFLRLFVGTLGGSPLWLTVIVVTAFYGLAAARRVAHAFDAACASVAALAVVGPTTFDLHTLVFPHRLPLLAVAVLQLAVGLRRASAGRCLLAACCLVAAASVQFQGTWFTAHRGLIPIHLLLAGVLLVAAVFRDRVAVFLQYLGAAALLAAGVASVAVDPQVLGNPPPLLLDVYPAAVIATAIVYGWLVGNRWYFASAGGVLAGWVALTGWQGYRRVRRAMPGLDYVAWGLVFFLVALLISLTKAGLGRRWWSRPQKERETASA